MLTYTWLPLTNRHKLFDVTNTLTAEVHYADTAKHKVINSEQNSFDLPKRDISLKH